MSKTLFQKWPNMKWERLGKLHFEIISAVCNEALTEFPLHMERELMPSTMLLAEWACEQKNMMNLTLGRQGFYQELQMKHSVAAALMHLLFKSRTVNEMNQLQGKHIEEACQRLFYDFQMSIKSLPRKINDTNSIQHQQLGS
jgi:hypothetical protein